MQQTTIRALTKLEFAYGLASRLAEAVNDMTPHTLEVLGELQSYVEVTRSAILLAMEHAKPNESGVCSPTAGRCTRCGRCWPPGSRGCTRSSWSSAATTCWRHPAAACSTTSGFAAARRGVPLRCQRHGRRTARRALPAGVGLRRLRTRCSHRPLRAQLPCVGPNEPHDGPHAGRPHRPVRAQSTTSSRSWMTEPDTRIHRSCERTTTPPRWRRMFGRSPNDGGRRRTGRTFCQTNDDAPTRTDSEPKGRGFKSRPRHQRRCSQMPFRSREGIAPS